MEGTTVGGYQLGRCLGTGATASVYLGTKVGETRQVAVKVLHPELAENRELLERFRREARALKSLTHTNIVGFVDFVEAEPHYLFVMELLDGGTLQEYLKKKGTVEPKRVLSWAAQLAAALAAAHAKKVVHRDIKPANIFITTTGRVVLSDFGLARPENDQLTVAGTKHLGTPLYMAPEQIVGRQATPATDVYQAGIVLHEMVTGSLPFPGDSPYDKLMARLNRDVAFQPEAEVPAPVREILRRCGFHDPALRYPDGSALYKDLEAANRGKALPFMPPVKLTDSGARAADPIHQDDDWKDPSRYPGTMLVVPKVNMQFSPRGKAFLVGSDPAVEVFLESDQIAPRQLRIAPAAGLWSLESGNFKAELRLNGKAIQAGRYALAHGDLIELGGYSMLWVDHGTPQAGRDPSPSPSGFPAGEAEKQGEGIAKRSPGGCLPFFLLTLLPTSLLLLLGAR